MFECSPLLSAPNGYLLPANTVKKQISTNGAALRIIRIIRGADHLGRTGWGDLPRKYVVIFELAAPARFINPPIGEFLPVIFHFFPGLAVASDLERL